MDSNLDFLNARTVAVAAIDSGLRYIAIDAGERALTKKEVTQALSVLGYKGARLKEQAERILTANNKNRDFLPARVCRMARRAMKSGVPVFTPNGRFTKLKPQDYVRLLTEPPFQGEAISNEHMQRPLADRLLDRKKAAVLKAAQMVFREAGPRGITRWFIEFDDHANFTVRTRPVWGRGYRYPIGTDLVYRVYVPLDWSENVTVLGGPVIKDRLILAVKPIRQCPFGSWVIAEVKSAVRSRGYNVRRCTDIVVRLGRLGEEGTEVKFLGDLKGDFTKAYRRVERMIRPPKSRKSNRMPDLAPGIPAFTPIPREDIDALGSL